MKAQSVLDAQGDKMLRTRFIIMLTIGVCLNAYAFAEGKYAVGTCLPKLPSYSTISQAVSNVPPGSIVEVCPGNYPEQVLITQPLTLEGVSAAGSDAVVVVPAGGLTQYAVDITNNDDYYQILAQNTTGVNITNLVVDGTGATVPPPDQPPLTFIVGIYYQSAGGSVSNSSIRNQASYSLGIGVRADGTGSPPTLTIENSVFRGQDDEGIIVLSGFSPVFNPTIKANTVESGEYAIVLISSGGTVEYNTLTNGLNLRSTAATVSHNIISPDSTAIVATNDGSTITANTLVGEGEASGLVPLVNLLGGSTIFKGNKIDAAGQLGVQMGGTNSILVQSNTIMNSSIAVNGCSGESQGATVIGNTITDAGIGLSMPSGNTAAPNTFHATAMALQPCD
jgi:Right handed beta helix region